VSYGGGTAAFLGLIAVMLFFAALGAAVLIGALLVTAGVVWALVRARSARATLLWAAVFAGASYLLLTLTTSQSWLIWANVAVLWLWTVVGLGRSEVLRRRAWHRRQAQRQVDRDFVWNYVADTAGVWRPYSGSLLDD
jgi:hypothetical protein